MPSLHSHKIESNILCESEFHKILWHIFYMGHYCISKLPTKFCMSWYIFPFFSNFKYSLKRLMHKISLNSIFLLFLETNMFSVLCFLVAQLHLSRAPWWWYRGVRLNSFLATNFDTDVRCTKTYILFTGASQSFYNNTYIPRYLPTWWFNAR